MIPTEQVKELREKTGISVMKCRKALEQAAGDIKKAEILLQKESHSVAQKKADRDLKAGTIQAYVHSNGNIGAMVELLCETDFVANNEEFKKLAYDLAMQVAATDPKFLKEEDISEKEKEEAKEAFKKELSNTPDQANKPEEVKEKILKGKVDSYFSDRVLMKQSFIKDPDSGINQLIESAIQKFGEKITVSNFVRFSIS